MKKFGKITLGLVAFSLLSATSYGQAVRDRNVIPVSVNLNQVLRMSITNGGNIEFTFNTINDYRNGISGDAANILNAQDATVVAASNAAASNPQYRTDFQVASSTNWSLTYGAENGTFIGTDDATNNLGLNNVGLVVISNAAGATGHTFQGSGVGQENISSIVTDNGNDGFGGFDAAALQQYPVPLMTQAGANANAGDVAENDFTIIWRCGTTEGNMNAQSILEQGNVTPDRYSVNVLFDLVSTP